MRDFQCILYIFLKLLFELDGEYNFGVKSVNKY